MSRRAPSSILFVCNLNRVRSPMAAALARRRYGPAVRADSCGLTAAELVDPFTIAAMEELGIDLRGHSPRRIRDLDADAYGLVVALSPEAHRFLTEGERRPQGDLQYWACADPTLVDGSREQRLEAYRSVRDSLERELASRFGPASTPQGRSGK